MERDRERSLYDTNDSGSAGQMLALKIEQQSLSIQVNNVPNVA